MAAVFNLLEWIYFSQNISNRNLFQACHLRIFHYLSISIGFPIHWLDVSFCLNFCLSVASLPKYSPLSLSFYASHFVSFYFSFSVLIFSFYFSVIVSSCCSLNIKIIVQYYDDSSNIFNILILSHYSWLYYNVRTFRTSA